MSSEERPSPWAIGDRFYTFYPTGTPHGRPMGITFVPESIMVGIICRILDPLPGAPMLTNVDADLTGLTSGQRLETSLLLDRPDRPVDFDQCYYSVQASPFVLGFSI